MTPDLSDLLARVGTALYSPDSLTRRDADLIYDDIDALVAEVERLRAHRELCTANLLKGYETGKAEERAAVVAWLREQRGLAGSTLVPSIARGHADSIERGEHRREEEP